MTTSTDTPTPLPDGFMLVGDHLMQLRGKLFTSVPSASVLTLHPESADDDNVVIDMTHMSSADIDKACRSLPKGFHGDGREALPGRARNMLAAAIDDKFIVTVDIWHQRVTVTFTQPLATIQALMLDCADRAGAKDWSLFRTAWMTQGVARWAWDDEAENGNGAMRQSFLGDYRLTVSREYTEHEGQPLVHRIMNVGVYRSSGDKPAKLTWKQFTDTVVDHSPGKVATGIAEAAQARETRAAVTASWDTEAASMPRENLRIALRAIRKQSGLRISALDQPIKPTGRGLDQMTTTLREIKAEGEVCRVIDGILAEEGKWDGLRRKHIEEVVANTVTKLMTTVLAEAANGNTFTFDAGLDNLHGTAYVVTKLAPLANVTVAAVVRA